MEHSNFSSLCSVDAVKKCGMDISDSCINNPKQLVNAILLVATVLSYNYEFPVPISVIDNATIRTNERVARDLTDIKFKFYLESNCKLYSPITQLVRSEIVLTVLYPFPSFILLIS